MQCVWRCVCVYKGVFCVYICVCRYVYVCVNAAVQVCVCARAHVQVCVCMCKCVYLCVCKCVWCVKILLLFEIWNSIIYFSYEIHIQTFCRTKHSTFKQKYHTSISGKKKSSLIPWTSFYLFIVTQTTFYMSINYSTIL